MPIVPNAEIKAVDIPIFIKALEARRRERERFKIVTYKLTIESLPEMLLTHQQKQSEKSHGKS